MLEFAVKRPYYKEDFNCNCDWRSLKSDSRTKRKLLVERLARLRHSLVSKGKEHIDVMDITIRLKTAYRQFENSGFLEDLENKPPSKGLKFENFKMPINVELAETVEDDAVEVNDHDNNDLLELQSEEVNRLMEALNEVKMAEEVSASGFDRAVNSLENHVLRTN